MAVHFALMVTDGHPPTAPPRPSRLDAQALRVRLSIGSPRDKCGNLLVGALDCASSATHVRHYAVHAAGPRYRTDGIHGHRHSMMPQLHVVGLRQIEISITDVRGREIGRANVRTQ